MELQYIPKTFWHSLSIAVLIVSTGLTYIAYRSGNVSIEIANAKINLSSEVAASTIALSSALEETKRSKELAQKEYETLIRKNVLINKQLDEVENQARKNNTWNKLKRECPECIQRAPIVTIETSSAYDQNIIKAEQSLNKLETLYKEIQPIK